MLLPRDIARLFLSPSTTLAAVLPEAGAPHKLLISVVTPLAAIRPAAVLLRALVAGAPLPGMVLAAAGLVLNLTFWVGAAVLLVRLAQQLSVELTARHAFALAAYACVPLYCAGLLYLVPDDAPAWLSATTRVFATVVALGGALLLHRGLEVISVRPEARLPLAAATTGAAILLYGLLSVIIGLSASLALYLLR